MAEHYLNIPCHELDEILQRTQIWPELSHKHLLITGGTGFFGRWVIASILRANEVLNCAITATVLTRNPEGFLTTFPEAQNDRLLFKQGDLRHTLLPVDKYSHVLHLATDSIANDPNEHLGLIDSVVTGTRRLLDHVANTCPDAKVLYASSGAMYGASQTDLISELLDTAPPPEDAQSFMSSAKRMAEQLCSVYSSQYDLDIKIARCFSFSGPHSPMQSYFAFGNFIHDALHNDAITIKGDGSAVRGYLYAGDLTAWLWNILHKGENCEPYNVGSDAAIDMENLAQTVSAFLAPDVPVTIAQKHKSASVSKYVPDISKARDKLGVSVWTNLETSILRTAEWYKRCGESSIPKAVSTSKTFVMDIDGVLANISPNNDYSLATPRQHNIAKLNKLYDAGHKIILFTARGYVTGIDWYQETEQQMQRWGVKYHELHLGKPAADVYVDDKMVPLELFSSIPE